MTKGWVIGAELRLKLQLAAGFFPLEPCAILG
jgi:hypothetical protein